MLKYLFFILTLLLTHEILSAQLNAEDYQVYACIIKTEIRDSTKSVAIIKYSIDSTEIHDHTFLTIEDLTSKNLNNRHNIYLWTENNKKERPSILDSSSIQFLIDYYKTKVNKFTLKNNFNQVYNTVLLKKYPIRRNSFQKDWTRFYEKYPGSGGIFSFSPIKYYSGDTTAIAYYWIRRNGLNGHGAIAVMTKTNSNWELKYKIYLWHN